MVGVSIYYVSNHIYSYQFFSKAGNISIGNLFFFLFLIFRLCLVLLGFSHGKVQVPHVVLEIEPKLAMVVS